MYLVAVKLLATKMREAIEAVPQEKLPQPMSHFPRGSCGDASLLLGAYLVDQGFNGFEYVCGERGIKAKNTWTSHAWLALGELVVDITADQFADAPSSVIVESPSLWHQQFEVDQKGPSDFRAWSGPGTYHLITMYAYLKPLLFASRAL